MRAIFSLVLIVSFYGFTFGQDGQNIDYTKSKSFGVINIGRAMPVFGFASAKGFQPTYVKAGIDFHSFSAFNISYNFYWGLKLGVFVNKINKDTYHKKFMNQLASDNFSGSYEYKISGWVNTQILTGPVFAVYSGKSFALDLKILAGLSLAGKDSSFIKLTHINGTRSEEYQASFTRASLAGLLGLNFRFSPYKRLILNLYTDLFLGAPTLKYKVAEYINGNLTGTNKLQYRKSISQLSVGLGIGFYNKKRTSRKKI